MASSEICFNPGLDWRERAEMRELQTVLLPRSSGGRCRQRRFRGGTRGRKHRQRRSRRSRTGQRGQRRSSWSLKEYSSRMTRVKVYDSKNRLVH